MKRMFAWLLAFLLCSLMMPLFAMDVVTLKGGEILSGQIIERDDDGGIILTLENGQRRYVMPNEIVCISQNDTLFTIVTKESKWDKFINTLVEPQNPVGLTIYAGCENLRYKHVYDSGFKETNVQSKSGGVVGVSYKQMLNFGFIFTPALEVGYSQGGFRTHDIFSLRLPVQFGYLVNFKPNVNLQISTGPVADFDITGDYRPVNVNWRFGLNMKIRCVMLGLRYGIGINNILHNKSMFDVDSAIRRNYLQVVVGYSF